MTAWRWLHSCGARVVSGWQAPAQRLRAQPGSAPRELCFHARCSWFPASRCPKFTSSQGEAGASNMTSPSSGDGQGQGQGKGLGTDRTAMSRWPVTPQEALIVCPLPEEPLMASSRVPSTGVLWGPHCTGGAGRGVLGRSRWALCLLSVCSSPCPSVSLSSCPPSPCPLVPSLSIVSCLPATVSQGEDGRVRRAPGCRHRAAPQLCLSGAG